MDRKILTTYPCDYIYINEVAFKIISNTIAWKDYPPIYININNTPSLQCVYLNQHKIYLYWWDILMRTSTNCKHNRSERVFVWHGKL